MTSSIVSEEIAVEQRHVDRVYARLTILRREAADLEKAGYRIAGVGNFGALVERDAMVYQAALRRRALEAQHEGLVFGRLDLLGGETRYVGRLGVRDDRAESLVVDWRAPAASPFYQATATQPMGVIRRRMIQSTGEQVIGVEDDLLDPGATTPGLRVVGDGALVATLARATGSGMRDIVATIQREQDEIIRSPGSGVTIVEGGPGTGKTAVALHRVAFLLYSDRQRFAGGGVLVVGPSPVFVSYISRVLPALGEDEAALRPLGEMVVGVTATRHDSAEVALVKGSLRMTRVLSRAARDAVPGGPRGLRLLYQGQLLRLSGAQLDDIRHQLLAPGARRNAFRAKAAGQVLDTLWRQSIELVPRHLRQPRDEFARDVADRREFREFMNAWWPMLRPVQVWRWLGDRERLHRYADGILKRDEIDLIAAAYGPAGGSGAGPVAGTGGAVRQAVPTPTIEDVPLLDELDELLGSPPAPRRRAVAATSPEYPELSTYVQRTGPSRREPAERPDDYREYAHIVVDESQDVSPMQWRMLGRRGENASWTIVGDPAQSSRDADPGETGRARDAAVGSRPRRTYTLSTNYRNPAEIFDLAAGVIRQVLPDIPLPVAVRRTGVLPRHLHVSPATLPDDTRAAAGELLDTVPGTVGVITPQDRRDEVAGWLGGMTDPRLQVVGSVDAKGMEYDGVLVVEPQSISDSVAGTRTLYVALSRATQRLTTVSTGNGWLPPH